MLRTEIDGRLAQAGMRMLRMPPATKNQLAAGIRESQNPELRSGCIMRYPTTCTLKDLRTASGAHPRRMELW